MKFPPVRFEPFAIVYLRVNGGMRGCVTGYLVRPGCPTCYLVTWSEDAEEKQHWAEELTTERPIDGVDEKEGE